MTTQISVIGPVRASEPVLEESLNAADRQSVKTDRLKRIAQICCLLAGTLGVLGLVGSPIGLPTLTRIRPEYVPTSPGASLALVLLSAALFQYLSSSSRKWRRMCAAAAVLLVVLLSGLTLIEYVSGLRLGTLAIFNPGAGSFLIALTTNLSPLSAAGLLLASISLLLLCSARVVRAINLAPFLALGVAAMNLVVIMGYVYRTPLLYGGRIQPVGLRTAIGLFVLGAGLMAAAGPDKLPLRVLLGSSVRARMLRSFLPITFVAVLVNEFVANYVLWHSLTNPALQAALQTLVVAVTVTGSIWQAARIIGASIDCAQLQQLRAEEALRRAKDELEQHVQERTVQLAQANEQLRNEIAEHCRTEAALRRSEARQCATLDALPDLIFRIGKDGTILDLRAPLCTGLTLPAECLIGRNLFEVLPISFHQPIKMHLERALTKGEIRTFEFQSPFNDSLCDLEGRVVASGENEVLAVIRNVTELRRLQQDILAASDRERQRVGLELHDGLGSHLTGLAFLSKALHLSLASQSIPQAEEAARIHGLIIGALEQTRRLAHGFCAFQLRSVGLGACLQELAANLQSIFDVSCACQVEGPVDFSDENTAMHLLRITQEAVNNAIRHGEAKRIKISLRRDTPQAVLQIKSDGLSFHQPVDQLGGMGIRAMKYRANRLGGTLEIGSDPAGGTVITCVFPNRMFPTSEDGW